MEKDMQNTESFDEFKKVTQAKVQFFDEFEKAIQAAVEFHRNKLNSNQVIIIDSERARICEDVISVPTKLY